MRIHRSWLPLLLLLISIIVLSGCSGEGNRLNDADLVCSCLNTKEEYLLSAEDDRVKDSIYIDCHLRVAVLKSYYLKQEPDKEVGEALRDSCELYRRFYD